MTPTESGVRMAATDERFKRARELDDIPEMRAALAKKTVLLTNYYGVPKRGSETGLPA